MWGPRSVGQGGTRLEEPIRKAVDGFGEAADISRVILLITDGEDHDSFPLEAADEARERGIKIITIGFGDEAGTKIQFTDPRTGVRTTVTDADGSPVISRLDGETLREIALRTEGAYIPAGTGALDLASIHQRHIVPLMRGKLDAAQQVVRNEAYQWAVVAGLTLLALSLLISQGGNWQPLNGEAASTSASTHDAGSGAPVWLLTISANDVSGQSPEVFFKKIILPRTVAWPPGPSATAHRNDSAQGAIDCIRAFLVNRRFFPRSTLSPSSLTLRVT